MGIVIKTAEAISKMLTGMIGDEIKARPITMLGGLLAKPAFAKVKEQLQETLARYRGERVELILILEEIQERLGYLPKEALLEIADFVLVQGDRREAGKKASRAVLAPQAIYRRHPHVQAIVLAHPVNATAFSVTDSVFDSRTIPESYVFLRDVRRVPYGVQYRHDGSLADYVSAAAPAAILENDGVLVTGSSVLDAFDRLEVLESTAEAVINAHAIGPVSAMPEPVIRELRDAFQIG